MQILYLPTKWMSHPLVHRGRFVDSWTQTLYQPTRLVPLSHSFVTIHYPSLYLYFSPNLFPTSLHRVDTSMWDRP